MFSRFEVKIFLVCLKHLKFSTVLFNVLINCTFFNVLMIVNNIITTIMGIKGKVNTVMKLTENCIAIYTPESKNIWLKKCITFIIVKTGKRLWNYDWSNEWKRIRIKLDLREHQNPCINIASWNSRNSREPEVFRLIET